MDIDEFDKQEFLVKLGSRIAKLRRSKGYSQDRACLEAGMSRVALSKIESGKVEPKISTIAIIALVIDVPLRRFLDLEF